MANQQLAMDTSLSFVHTARRCYRLVHRQSIRERLQLSLLTAATN